MRLWLRYRQALGLTYDHQATIGSQDEWRDFVSDPAVVSSVLWPEAPLFGLSGPHYAQRRHPHEKKYCNDPQRNLSYREGCQMLAERLEQIVAGARCLIYAPLRGALPIWKVTSQYLSCVQYQTYYPVTSSFVFYPASFGISNSKGRPASGRFTNLLELRRLRPFLEDFDYLIYVDEIVSGGTMKGHLQEMFQLGIEKDIAVVACGLADSFGERSTRSRRVIEKFVDEKKVNCFLWEGCQTLITEDQRFLLGMHYVDYLMGPNAVPMLDRDLNPFPERVEFDNEVMPLDGVRCG